MDARTPFRTSSRANARHIPLATAAAFLRPNHLQPRPTPPNRSTSQADDFPERMVEAHMAELDPSNPAHVSAAVAACGVDMRAGVKGILHLA
jgi:hypothetical protein